MSYSSSMDEACKERTAASLAIQKIMDEMGLHFFNGDLEGKFPILDKLPNVEQKTWQEIFQDLLMFPAVSNEPGGSAIRLPGEVLHEQSANAQMKICSDPNSSQVLEQESCITGVSELCPLLKAEGKDQYSNSDTAEDGVSDATQEDHNAVLMHLSVSSSSRKRKRARISKNSEEVESQRKTHIEVERNRRKQMNEHLNVLRSMIPRSYIPRGDQASIIGGAIDLVKELELSLQSLQFQKMSRDGVLTDNGLINPKQYYESLYPAHCSSKYALENCSSDLRAENKSAIADIEVTVIETHASLKVVSVKRPGQLLKTITALESLHMTTLHLNISSVDRKVLYSFNVKIEDECQLTSASEIATALHQIFRIIHSETIFLG